MGQPILIVTVDQMCWRRILIKSNFQLKFYGAILLAGVATCGWFTNDANAQLLTPPAQPLTPAAKAAAQQFLNDYWDRGLDARRQAAERYETAPQDQVVVQFAYALNRAQQGKSREAIEVLGAINQRVPANLDAWLLKAWHLALTDQHDQTLTALGALAQQFSQTKQPLDPVGKKSLLQRMGRLVGYLEGPVKHTVNGNLLSVTVDRIEQNLDAASVKEFNEGRQQVDQVLQQLIAEQSQTAAERLKRVAAENKAEAERLKQENERLEDSESRLTPQRVSLVAAGNEEISNLEQQASSLLAQLNSVNADAYIVEQDLAYALADLNRFQRQDRRYRPSYQFRAHIDNLSYRLSVLRATHLRCPINWQPFAIS